ncbi:hypothetical protein Hamer_G023286 [Homarus americanus]|uniref:Uncharacterized protein n=1 Tax=Homarus americanus TaxID=6706 RepID=A0A8J5JYY6_HOMAM|nr:hypothetical protein Hamer_G023286 [Homarus americanus]
MPGFHGSKVAFQPEMHMMHTHQRLRGKASPMVHPMFDALRSRHALNRADYVRMMKMREHGKRMGIDGGYPTFDSLKLLGSDNDANYLDVFMSRGGRMRHSGDENDSRPRTRSVSHTSKASSKRNSVDVQNIKKTLLGSLRSTASEENLYESVEVIQYRKTIEAIARQNKVRSVPKTGHPLFDHLRIENVLKPRRQQHSGDHHQRRSEAHNSDGGSNSHSSSGSGDEFDYNRKPNCRFSRREVLMCSQVPATGAPPETLQQTGGSWIRI